MARSMWTGTLSAGMLVIPVKLSPAVGKEDRGLHQVRKSDGSRIKYKRFAEADGEEVQYADIGYGYELLDGRMVVVDRQDFAEAYGDRTHKAEILTFVDADSVPRAAHDATYYVEPGDGGAQAYKLLATALAQTGKCAVVSLAIRERESLALLAVTGDGFLTLERLVWSALVKAPDFTVDAEVSDAQVAQAVAFVEVLSEDFDWSAQKDEGAQRLAALIKRKADNGQTTGVPARPAGPAVTLPGADLAEVLRASVQAAKDARAAKEAPPKRTRKPRTPKAPAAKEAS